MPVSPSGSSSPPRHDSRYRASLLLLLTAERKREHETGARRTGESSAGLQGNPAHSWAKGTHAAGW
jgi:hypothetical protein